MYVNSVFTVSTSQLNQSSLCFTNGSVQTASLQCFNTSCPMTVCRPIVSQGVEL